MSNFLVELVQNPPADYKNCRKKNKKTHHPISPGNLLSRKKGGRDAKENKTTARDIFDIDVMSNFKNLFFFFITNMRALEFRELSSQHIVCL